MLSVLTILWLELQSIRKIDIIWFYKTIVSRVKTTTSTNIILFSIFFSYFIFDSLFFSPSLVIVYIRIYLFGTQSRVRNKRRWKRRLARHRLAPVCLYRQADLASGLGDPRPCVSLHLSLRKDYFSTRERKRKRIRNRTLFKINWQRYFNFDAMNIITIWFYEHHDSVS